MPVYTYPWIFGFVLHLKPFIESWGGRLYLEDLSLRDLPFLGWVHCHLSLWSLSSQWCEINPTVKITNCQVLKASIQRECIPCSLLNRVLSKSLLCTFWGSSSQISSPAYEITLRDVIWTKFHKLLLKE